MSFYALVLIGVCCIAWMTRPGHRPQFVVLLDVLLWLCVAGFVELEGVLGVVLAWTAVPLIYFSIKYNHPESLAVPAGHSGMSMGPN